MAEPPRSSRWAELPDEILLSILSFLEPYHITQLQPVCRKWQKLCLDDELWKRHCFEDSPWYYYLKTRRNFHFMSASSRSQTRARHLSEDEDHDEDTPQDHPVEEAQDDSEPHQPQQPRWRKLQDMANWDPVFPGERVSWYDEYIQRHGPACVNWLETPRMRDRGAQAFIEARGMAIYNPYDGDDGRGTMLAVSPLDDASVCLWDIRGTRGKQGSIVANSKPGILFFDGPGGPNTRRSKRIDTGVIECVSIDNHRHRAFFAVQSHLIEVDLNRLDVVSRESFEWSITTLSPIHEGVPLTVGTSLGIHLHDFRARARVQHDVVDRVDAPGWDNSNILRAIFNPEPLPPYAPLSQPTPINILHLPQPGSHSLVSDDIFVAGRFTNILHYDRRKFPAIVSSIHSGGLIKSLAALPYPYSTVDDEVRRMGDLTVEQAEQRKVPNQGRTLIAAGGYNSKGSLEIYGLNPVAGAMLKNSTMKNRQTAASSTILSVANHGTKIVFSDGSGFLKWFERDGITECRRIAIGHSDDDVESSLFATATPDDLARKILSTKSQHGVDRPNNDNILFWTGEKLGLLSFTTTPLCTEQDFRQEDTEMTEDEDEEQLYTGRMRMALERQADEVKFVRDLGAGPSSG